MPVLAFSWHCGITDDRKVAYHSSISIVFFDQVPYIKKKEDLLHVREVMSPHRSHVQSSHKWAKIWTLCSLSMLSHDFILGHFDVFPTFYVI